MSHTTSPANRSQNRIAAGVPTGGQFAASAKGEAGVRLGPLDVHEPVDDVDNHSTCPATWGEKCREHRERPGVHLNDMEIRACVEGAHGEVFSNAPEAKAEFFTLYSAMSPLGCEPMFTAVKDYDTREEARAALAKARKPEQPATPDVTPVAQEPVANLAAALAGYRMNRAAARTSIDAYREAVNDRPALTGPKELAQRSMSLDVAALTTYTSLHALRPTSASTSVSGSTGSQPSSTTSAPPQSRRPTPWSRSSPTSTPAPWSARCSAAAPSTPTTRSSAPTAPRPPASRATNSPRPRPPTTPPEAAGTPATRSPPD